MFSKISYQIKIFAFIALIILSLIFAAALVLFRSQASFVRQSITNNNQDALELMKKQTDLLLEGLDDVTKTIHSSPELMEILRDIPNRPENHFDVNPRINDQINSIMYLSLMPDNIKGRLSLVTRYFDYIGISKYNSNLRLSKAELAEVPEITQAMQSKEFRIFNNLHPDPWSPTGDPIISVTRPLRDSFNIYGVLEYSISVSALAETLNISSNGDVPRILVADESGQIIFNRLENPEDEHWIQSQYEAFASQNSGMIQMDALQTAYYTHLDSTGWTLILLSSSELYKSQVALIKQQILVIALLILVLTLLLAFIFTRSLTRPIRKLKNNLTELTFDKTINLHFESSNNEVIVLASAIEDILNKIRIQNAHLIAAKEQEIKAYLVALDAQLNPHFLYNTLAVIGAFGSNSGNETVAKMCNELARLLRYSISYTNQPVTLQDEVNNLKSYLYIMEMRYQQFLEINWDVDDTLGQTHVPKLILQPIAENCFTHGFQNVEPIWKIWITTYQVDNQWRVKIQNNGSLIDQDTQKQLHEQFDAMKRQLVNDLPKPELQSEKLGLTNTVMRLAYFYSGQEYFHISTENNRTIIEIGGPMID